MPGAKVRTVDRVLAYFASNEGAATAKDIWAWLAAAGKGVALSSISSCLCANAPGRFERIQRGRYRLSLASGAKTVGPRSKYTELPTVRTPRMKSRQDYLTSFEVCAGAGGMALGLEQGGFESVALVEIDHHACATLVRNRPHWNVIQTDMRFFNAEQYSGTDLLSGGLPCPPFSIAGKQLGSDDDRDMFPSMLRIVEQIRPRAILIENVRGILTSRFGNFREQVSQTLYQLGFDTYWMGFNAADFGVPQNRYRAFLIGLRRGETRPLSWPIPMLRAAPTVGKTLADMMGARGWHGVSDWVKKACGPAPTIVGGSHKHGGPDLGPTRARKEWAQLGVDGLGLANEPPHPEFLGMPRLTVPMVARLQSFPDEWVFEGKKTHQYRQVGNALPVGLAFTMAKAIKECLV